VYDLVDIEIGDWFLNKFSDFEYNNKKEPNLNIFLKVIEILNFWKEVGL
jgi:hypothetical protein